MQEKKNIPDRLQDYGIDYVCKTANLTVNSSRYSDGRTPLEIIRGETPDLSEYLDFGSYEWVTYRNNAGLGIPEVGRWLCVSHRFGQLMSYWILPKSGIPVSCTTVQKITNLEKLTDEYKARMKDFDVKLDQKQAVQYIDLREQREEVPQPKLLLLEDKDE